MPHLGLIGFMDAENGPLKTAGAEVASKECDSWTASEIGKLVRSNLSSINFNGC